MTPDDVLKQIRAIVHERSRRKDKSAEVRDLERFDRIVGLLRRYDNAEVAPGDPDTEQP
jgi:hypothetical protein